MTHTTSTSESSDAPPVAALENGEILKSRGLEHDDFGAIKEEAGERQECECAIVSESAGLHAKTNSKTRAKTSTVATVPRLIFFGLRPLLLGEDDATYSELLSRVRNPTQSGH